MVQRVSGEGELSATCSNNTLGGGPHLVELEEGKHDSVVHVRGQELGEAVGYQPRDGLPAHGRLVVVVEESQRCREAKALTHGCSCGAHLEIDALHRHKGFAQGAGECHERLELDAQAGEVRGDGE